MTEIVIPPRDWGDDEPEPAVVPVVIVSSRDGRGDPGAGLVDNRRAAWRGLAVRAAKAGWAVRVTYALAHVPDTHWGHGGLRKAAHYVHSVALRLARGAERALAIWRRETVDERVPPDEWKNDCAAVGWRFMGVREWTLAITA
jgi:hypothetical protein